MPQQGRRTTQRQKNAVPSRHREGTARRRQIPDLVKRLATATGSLGVGVGNFEARLHQAVNIVDFRTGEIQSALHVNKDLDPIAHEHLVVGILLFLKTHLILQTRTAATNDAHTQGVFLLHISRGKLANLAGGRICNGNHFYPPVSEGGSKGSRDVSFSCYPSKRHSIKARPRVCNVPYGLGKFKSALRWLHGQKHYQDRVQSYRIRTCSRST